MFFKKPVDQLTAADIDSFIVEKIPEGKLLDYKEALNVSTDGEKKELLKDVASFANASGGYIVFGVSEQRDAANKKTGMPEKAVGLEGANDQTLITIADIIRAGIAPRVPVAISRLIHGSYTKGPVIVLHVAKSWAGPHMVSQKNDESRFWSRHGNGKYFMDVDEIRTAFSMSEAVTERIGTFRTQRIGKVMSGDVPIKVHTLQKVILHLMPVSAFDRRAAVDLNTASVHNFQPVLLFPGLDYKSGSSRFNLDGCLFPAFERPFGSQKWLPIAYSQIFRSGAIEAVSYLESETAPDTYLPLNFGKNLARVFWTHLGLLRSLSIEPPMFIGLTLIYVTGWKLYPCSGQMPSGITRSNEPFDREHLILPEQFLESFDGNPTDLLRPTLDALWQAGGWSRYFEAGPEFSG